jgi:stage II sporulation protein D
MLSRTALSRTTAPRLTRALAPLLALAVAVGAGSPASASASASVAAREGGERRAASIRLVGNGYGHGHGLSQYGAQARATAGQSHEQILGFYYPGLKAGPAGGKVSVLISADHTRDVMVDARSGLTVAQVGGGKSLELSAARPAAKRWRIVPVGGTSRIDFLESGWRTLATWKGAAEFSAGKRPVTLHVTATQRVAYRGALRAVGGDTVNVVSLEGYLKGVVPREVPALWHPEAVQAQAVAARTYAAYERDRPLARHYQLCDTSQCQVYGGYSAEQPASNRAVAATARQVLTSGGQPAFTQFSASNGGWTSAGGFAYLPAKEDPQDTVYRGWTDAVTAAEVERAYPAIGAFRRATVLQRDGHGEWGGRVLSIQLVGATRSATISGETFRSVFGLNSTYFTVR